MSSLQLLCRDFYLSEAFLVLSTTALNKTLFPKQPSEIASGKKDREEKHWLQASKIEVPGTRTTDLSPSAPPQPHRNPSHDE